MAEAYRLLAKLMRDAVDGLIVTSPCTIPGAGQDDSREMRDATPNQVAEVTRLVPDRYRALALVAAYGGLRFGEAAGDARSIGPHQRGHGETMTTAGRRYPVSRRR